MTTMSREEEKKKIDARIATESCHWYAHDGTPVHEVPKVSDPTVMRPTTKADAKKMKLVPSVTNLLGRYDSKPGLDEWKRNKIFDQLNPSILTLMATALNEGKQDVFNDLCKGVDEDARADASRAAELGTRFHYAMEILSECFNAGGWQSQQLFTEKLTRSPAFKGMPQFRDACIYIFEFLHSAGAIGISNVVSKHLSEKSVTFNMDRIGVGFLNMERGGMFGLGGKIDLIVTYKGPGSVPEPILDGLDRDDANHIRTRLAGGYEVRAVFDFKTRKPNRLKNGKVSFPCYPSDVAQIAGYREGVREFLGFGIDFCGNILVPSDIIDDSVNPPSGWRTKEPIQMRLYGSKAITAGMRHLRSCAELWVADEYLAAMTKRKKPGDPLDDYAFVPFIEDSEI